MELTDGTNDSNGSKFRFPSNGKTHSDQTPDSIAGALLECVTRFDSLQTGKCVTHVDLLSDLDDLGGSCVVTEGGGVGTAEGEFTE